ncbi:M48 family metallopeptidase [Natronogracilivirga saccharolytica]|uniref:M48 family metallopeptidase n=1 Tax=Natronogracilivirga saccharolytica TaxID=2812953 RepID=A0A8J7RJJ6_9BACT|nr:M48 family metallopeptidase [Natronogracilivirga saccharolytica]MBP3191343.1 M48 family metallopeptidase [Natronogracilivirga saccharolytica]
MKKPLLQLFLSILVIAGIWYGLSRIDFLGETTTESIGRETEKKLGELLLKQLELQHPRSANDSLLSVIENIHRELCDSNGVDPESIDIHLFDSSVINAAVIPGRNIIIFTGLLDYTENADEFAGVLAHELAHITENHVMERLQREFGITLLMTLSGMDAGTEIISNVLRILTTTAYSRQHEREADEKAFEYMVETGWDPAHLANFLLRISTKTRDGVTAPQWIQTHPDPRDRAAAIIEKSNKLSLDEDAFRPVSDSDWQSLVSQ